MTTLEKLEEINLLCAELKKENLRLRNLLGKIYASTQQFYTAKDKTPDDCPYDAIVALYHKLTDFAQVRAMTANRRIKMRKRWQNDLPTLKDWEAYFRDAASKSFLCGQNDRRWRADLDFLLREDALYKTQEGKYDE